MRTEGLRTTRVVSFEAIFDLTQNFKIFLMLFTKLIFYNFAYFFQLNLEKFFKI